MALERKASVAVGLGSVAVVWGVYNQVLPRVIDARVAPVGSPQLASAEKTARWTSAAFVLGLAGITMDATVAIFGMGAVIAFSWMHRHANMVDPNTAAAYQPSSRQTMHAADSTDAGYTPGG